MIVVSLPQKNTAIFNWKVNEYYSKWISQSFKEIEIPLISFLVFLILKTVLTRKKSTK